MKIKRKSKVEAYIPTASMADIAFLLIIFFMVTTTFATGDRTKVDLPKTQFREEMPKNAARVVIADDGSILVTSGEEVPEAATMSSLGTWATQILEQDPSRIFVIRAAKTTAYSVVNDVFEQLEGARALKIDLATDQKTEEH